MLCNMHSYECRTRLDQLKGHECKREGHVSGEGRSPVVQVSCRPPFNKCSGMARGLRHARVGIK